jgi:hypothetical protein
MSKQFISTLELCHNPSYIRFIHDNHWQFICLAIANPVTDPIADVLRPKKELSKCELTSILAVKDSHFPCSTMIANDLTNIFMLVLKI